MGKVLLNEGGNGNRIIHSHEPFMDFSIFRHPGPFIPLNRSGVFVTETREYTL